MAFLVCTNQYSMKDFALHSYCINTVCTELLKLIQSRKLMCISYLW